MNVRKPSRLAEVTSRDYMVSMRNPVRLYPARAAAASRSIRAVAAKSRSPAVLNRM
jgi:hypothetical protein